MVNDDVTADDEDANNSHLGQGYTLNMKTPKEQAQMLIDSGAPKMLAVWAINSASYQSGIDGDEEYWKEVMTEYLSLTAPSN